MSNDQSLTILEEALNDFSPEKRWKALNKIRAAEIKVDKPGESKDVKINLHAHTFFSFNAYGLSPSALAWKAKKEGLDFIGKVDFDVLDGVSEFLDACELLEIKGVAGIETRVFIPSYDAVEINSPGEPGIAYHMGTGVTSSKLPEATRPAFTKLREKAAERNQEIIRNLNDYLSPLSIDFETDILPLTPSGNVTERHIVHKLVDKAFAELENPEAFWQEKLSIEPDEMEILLKDRIKFENIIRKKLIKRGGVAYVKPDPRSFPTIEAFNHTIQSVGAIPCMAWLDGTSAGENDIERLLSLMIEKGVGAVNIIPDRNWNIADEKLKARKIKELNKIVALAEERQLPILIGTEMNSYGQKFVDDLSVEELAPLKEFFIKGAQFLYGHTRLERLWAMGYESAWANEHFKTQHQKLAFYTEIGKVIPPGFVDEKIQKKISSALSPQTVLNILNKGSNR